MTRPPVVVVGCGPTGACAAIMLAQRGVDVLVLERWPDPYPLPRAVHFDDEVFRILAGLGIGERLAEISRPAPGMQLVDSALRVLAEFRRDSDGTTHGYPQANMFDQPDLEAVLRARIAELDRIEVRTGAEVIGVDHRDAGARVRVREVPSGDEYDVDTDAVLACDGANSAIRMIIGSRLDDLGFEQQWMVVDVTSTTPLDVYPGVQQVCDHDRAATFMMVTPGRYRWEFRLRAGETADEIDDAEVLRLIRPWLGVVPPSEITVLRRAWYTFRGAVADRWSDGRVFLLGDAAHLTPPFIGQGMCAGVRDAENLTWKLALVLAGVADSRLLDTYEPERKAHVRQVVRLAIVIGWVMTGGSAVSSLVRRIVMRGVTRLPGVERRVVDAAMPTLSGSALLARADRAAGLLCPQPHVDLGERTVLLDDVLGRGFAVIAAGGDGQAAFDPDTRRYFEALGTTFVTDATSPGFDLEHALDGFLDGVGARAVLIRPDRVVAASSDRIDLRRWRGQLEVAGIDGGTHVR